METLKSLLQDIGLRILQYCFEKGLGWLAEALGIERGTLVAFVVIPGLLILFVLEIHERLTRSRAAGISPEVTPEREAP